MSRAALATVLGAAAALVAAPAHAERFWDAAARTADERAADATARAAIEDGDHQLIKAADPESVMADRERLRLGGLAIAAYEAALAAQPGDVQLRAEAAYRAGAARFALQVECKGTFAIAPTCRGSRAAAAETVLARWHEFTDLAPLDTRATPLLFERALLHTRMLLLGTDAPTRHLQAAADDYQARIDREVSSGRDLTTITGNLAETYMMLGDLDRAIAAYETVQRLGSDASQTYGLAVALDRDGQGMRARALARRAGLQAYEGYVQRVEDIGEIFYVPEGEKYYYFALVEEALGLDTSALAHWDQFLASGAYPQFAERARTNRAAVAARLAASARRVLAPSPRRR